MAVVAVSTVRNESDVVGSTFRHLLAEGVAEVLVAVGPSFDGTREVLEAIDGVRIFDDSEQVHYQPRWMNSLARIAQNDGAEWILPVDADEFWYATEGGTIGGTLDGLPASVGVCPARMFKHSSWSDRHVEPTALPKVAYRCRGALSPWITNGNHHVTGTVGEAAWGVLDIREFQYRGFEHFKRKVAERCATLDPSLPAGEGWHHVRLKDATEQELEQAWRELEAIPTVHDPCPSSFPFSTDWT